MKNNFDKNSILVASGDQVSADLSPNTSEDIVILNLKDGIYYELKDVAARVWGLIQQPCSIQAILDTLVEEYEVEAKLCEADLIALAEDLAKRGLISANMDCRS